MNKAIIHEQGQYKPVGIEGTANPPMPPDNWPYHNHPTTPHDPEFGIKNPKFERHIFIRRDQVLFDIESQIGMIAKARRKDDGSEDDALTSATTSYQQQFYRWIDKHIGIAKTKMQTFVLEQFKKTEMNSIKDKEEVDIELLMPLWWDDTVFEQLCSAVHDYVVNATMHEFLKITLTSKDAVTVDKEQEAEEALADIRKLANAAKPGRIRKPFKPF